MIEAFTDWGWAWLLLGLGAYALLAILLGILSDD